MTSSPISPPADADLNRRHALAAGILYLVIIVSAGFAEGVVRSGLVVPGDAGATAESIAGAIGLWQWGLVADLVAFTADLGVAVLFYLLLCPVDRTVALVAAALRLVAHPAIASINLLNHWAAGAIAEHPEWMTGLTPVQLDGLALLAVEMHGWGYLLAGGFFGAHLVLLGWLLLRSPHAPVWLGLLVGVAGLAYTFETVAHIALPQLAAFSTGTVVAAAVLGEVTLCVWLLGWGFRSRRPGD